MAYASAGVNIDAGNRAVDLMRDAVRSTYDARVLAGIGNRVAGERLFVVSPQIAVVALLLAIALSLASGLLPAIRAARLDPMRALRYE